MSDLGIRIKGTKSVEVNGAYVDTIEPWHPLEIFHPIGDKTPTVDIGVKVKDPDTGEYVDLSKLLAPLAAGDKITTGATGIGTLSANGQLVDAEDMYAMIGSVPIPLNLVQIPKGDFNCETYLFTYMDTSGSMNSVLPAARAAVAAMRTYFKKIYYNDNQALANQYIKSHVDSGNEAWLSWFANSTVGGQAPHNCVSIAFINESNSIYHGGHPTASFNSHKNTFTANYNGWIAGGGNHHSAIMGLAYPRPWSLHFSYHVLDAINVQGLGAMNVQGFMGLDASGGTAYFVGLMVDWLNIPQTPSDLVCRTTAVDDQQHNDKVTWNFSDIICGLTGTYNAATASKYDQTQSGWVIEVATDAEGDDIIYTSAEASLLPSTYTYNEGTTKKGSSFWCRLTAKGMNGNADHSGDWVLCRMANQAPTITVLGSNPLTVYTNAGVFNDPGFTATDDHDPDNTLINTTVYPEGFDPTDISSLETGTFNISYTSEDRDGAKSGAGITARALNVIRIPFAINWTTTVNNPCDPEPWVISNGATSLRYNITDSSNCGGTCNSIQAGSATADIQVGSDKDVIMTMSFTGVGERELPQYELMDFKLNGTVIARGHAPGGNQACTDGPVVTQYFGTPQWTLTKGTAHTFSADFTTADHLFHTGCYYQVNLSFTEV